MTPAHYPQIAGFHRTTMRHAVLLLIAAATLLVTALLMIWLGTGIVFQYFGMGLIVGSPLLVVDAIAIHIRHGRRHEAVTAATLRPVDDELTYVSELATANDMQKRKSTYLLIGLMLTALVGAFTIYTVVVLVSAMALLLVISVQYIYSIIFDFRLSEYQHRLTRHPD